MQNGRKKIKLEQKKKRKKRKEKKHRTNETRSFYIKKKGIGQHQ